MISCHRAAELTSRELDQRLPALQELAVGFHRLLCPGCRRYRDQLAEVNRVAGELLAAEGDDQPDARTLTEDARERIRHALRGEAAAE